MFKIKIEEAIKPFLWVSHEDSSSVILTVGSYNDDIFLTRASEGFEGNGYDWASLAQVFLSEKFSSIEHSINFDPEGSMFCAYSDNAEDLKDFILGFKSACDDKEAILDFFSRAVLD